MNIDVVFIIGVFGAVTVGGAVFSYSIYAAREFYRLRCLDHWSERFAEKAAVVLDDPQAPPLTVEMLDFINARVGDPSVVRPLCVALRVSRYATTRPPGSLPNEIAACDAALRDKINDAICAGVLALSYSEWYWGVRARANLAGLITEAARNPKPIMDVVERMPEGRLRPRRHAVLEAA